MFTGSPDELREIERKAQRHAEQIQELLNKLEALSSGQVVIGRGEIHGPGFIIRHRGDRWHVQY